MFKLTHRLFESISLNTDEIDGGNTNISKKDFTKMAIGCHVRNRTHFNTRRIHRHDDFTDPCMWRTIIGCATNEVAIIGHGTETGPNLLTIDDPVVAIKHGLSFQ